MNRVAEFFVVDMTEFTYPPHYGDIRLPKRATSGSAGYDFFAPFDIFLNPNETKIIPTGIRVRIDEGWVLTLFPRSGLGFRYSLALNNTVGIIDSDYFYSANQGHILISLRNGERPLEIKKGEAFVQGIFLPFGITKNDYETTKRDGGFGSTDSKA